MKKRNFLLGKVVLKVLHLEGSHQAHIIKKMIIFMDLHLQVVMGEVFLHIMIKIKIKKKMKKKRKKKKKRKNQILKMILLRMMMMIKKRRTKKK